MMQPTELISALLPPPLCVCMCEYVCAYSCNYHHNQEWSSKTVNQSCYLLTEISQWLPVLLEYTQAPAQAPSQLPCRPQHCCLVGARRPSDLQHLWLLPSGLLVLDYSLLCPFSSIRSQPTGHSRWLLAMSQHPGLCPEALVTIGRAPYAGSFASLFLGEINAMKADTLSTVIPLDLNTKPGDQ